VPGLDAEDGLRRLAGNRKLYRTLLGKFIAEQETFAARIDGALARVDRESAERLAHTVRGVAGNLGARRVQGAATELENAIRAGAAADRTAACLETLRAAVADLVARLAPYFPAAPARAEPAAAAAAEIDPENARRTVAEMLGHLGNFDPAASDCLEANRALFRALLLGEAFPAFEAKIGGFEFAEAHDRLARAAKERGVLPS
jgi:HPt (histidine-containing phosphotransfer) domain-containing protein